MNRRDARELAFSLIFEREFNREEPIENFFSNTVEFRETETDEYVKNVFFGVEENRDEIDKIADKYFENWKRNRISNVTEAIIRLAVYEMMYTDIPSRVSINEAIELSKKFDEEKAKNFINGVLNSVAKEISGEMKKENEQ